MRWKGVSSILSLKCGLAAQEIGIGLPLADECGGVTVYENLGGQETRVVVRGHGEAVGPGIAEGQDLVNSRVRHLPWRRAALIAGEHVARFANGARHERLLRRSRRCLFLTRQELDTVKRAVHGRPHQVVEASVDQGEVIAAGPGARKEDGNRAPLDVSVGDKVLYARYSGTTIKLNGKEYLILKESDILAVVEN